MARLDLAIERLRAEFVGHATEIAADKAMDLAFGQRLWARVSAVHAGTLPEILCLAARFHYPISPGYWREVQWRMLQEVGYTLAEARRIVNLMERYRCLDGDPEMLMLMEHTGHILLFEDIYPKSDRLWAYRIQEIWNHLPVAMQKAGRDTHTELKRLSLIERGSHGSMCSAILGPSVYAGTLYRMGFPNVMVPMLRHAVELSVGDSEEITENTVDAALLVWLAMDREARDMVTPLILENKRINEEACGEREPVLDSPEQVWDHIDLNWATIDIRHDRLCLTMSGDCAWEPEHGLQIRIDEKGGILNVGEVA